jgi:hypothetical protein
MWNTPGIRVFPWVAVGFLFIRLDEERTTDGSPNLSRAYFYQKILIHYQTDHSAASFALRSL